MVTARIQFKPGQGRHFCPGDNQDIIEIKFESPGALMEVLREFKEDIYDCTAQINGKTINLRKASGLDAPA